MTYYVNNECQNCIESDHDYTNSGYVAVSRPRFLAARKQFAIDKLKSILTPGRTVHVAIDHVSRSGMSRRMTLFVTDGDGVRRITNLAAYALGWPLRDASLVVSGCGMDMAFHAVYSLSSCIFDGNGCALNHNVI